MAVPVVSNVMKKVFGTRNDRMVKRYLKVVDEVSSFEPQIRQLTDAELMAKTDEFRQRIAKGDNSEAMMPEVFAVAREAMDRNVGIRNIFNPEAGFDPSQLPDDARSMYDEVQKTIESTEPAAPEGLFLGNSEAVPSWKFVDIPNRLYEAVRELYPQSKPPFRARPFDVQVIGAIVLYEGRIAEMKTGEGKTIVAPLATYLACIEDMSVHVVTVNSYLVQRDRDWTFPFFRSLGLTVGAIHPFHMQPPQMKQLAYMCDVVYGTTAEFGFDYLRDNMKLSVQEQVQRKRDFAIVDEVDSTLIDEARTPLIISGQAHQEQPRYELADRLARHLVEMQREWNTADEKVNSCLVAMSTLEGDIRNARDKDAIPEMKEKLDAARARLPELESERDRFTQYYEVELDKKRAHLTHEGIAEAQKKADVGSFYVGGNIDIPHLLENAIRAHSVYQRDRDYVVAPDDEGRPSVVIVDQNTGRKMVGRQWSDGLHQAVEAKEGVPIKEETQTMATITIQNFFKLYDKLAGMTGTADTEATEFYEIYKLDVIVIPTNVPVARLDRNDLVFIAEKDKWDAIVDEIKYRHDVGQPVLVGTTSVEKSEMLSDLLKRKYSIEHNVLNAKQHEREAEIILDAGKLGAVMIATNMAGRGTDIKLGRYTREELINHWRRRNLCGRDVTADMDDDAIRAGVYRHIAARELGMRKDEVADMSDDDIRMELLRHWYTQHVWMAGDPSGMSESKMMDDLDAAGSCVLHRLRMYENVNDMGGLHVVATERHESRRVDNQLRGRSGRQGDNGSSRFFLSLEDDLMKMFAGPTTLKVLSRLGMKEGDAIEHPMLTRSVGKAQRKVEERNFLIRKQILEYDEVMDLHRHEFYDMRQSILEGRGIKSLIFDFIDESMDEAIDRFLDKNFVARVISERVREELNVTIDPDRIRNKIDDRTELHKFLGVEAKEEASSDIRVTIGEFLSEEDPDESNWDWKGLVDWANANFNANLTVPQAKEMSRKEVINHLEATANELIDSTDLDPLDQYLVPNYGPRELSRWAKDKLLIDINPEDYVELEDPTVAYEQLKKAAREAYEDREIVYPVEFAIENAGARMEQDRQGALEYFSNWVKAKYELDWKPDALPSTNPVELRELLLAEARTWDAAKITARAEKAVAATNSPDELDAWLRENCRMAMTDEEKERAATDPKTVAEEKIAELLRVEITQFERWVLLQIVDGAWKDHLHSIDQLRESIGYRSFSQKDPRIEFKREGARLFEEMYSVIRDRVTDLIFKGKLRPAAPQQGQRAQQPPQGQQQAAPPAPVRRRRQDPGEPAPQRPAPTPAQSAVAAAAAAASMGTTQQRRDLETAQRAGSDSSAPKKQQPRRKKNTVGRNEPCPCGSGKKYKKCCGA